MGRMSTRPEIVQLSNPIEAVGLMMTTSMKGVYKDVPDILKRYMTLKEKHGLPQQKLPWEYVSLSKNFTDDNTWEYFTGHVVDRHEAIPEAFASFVIPAGKYAVFSVRPKFKCMLGVTIGKTKKYIYQNWLPTSGFEFTGFEFEYNNENMFHESPHYIDLYIGVKEK